MSDSVSIKKLAVGAVSLHNCGDLRLHAYYTNDPLTDVVFILEREQMAVLIEQPNFTANFAELEQYLSAAGLKPEAIIAPYHLPGGFMPSLPRYITKQADDYARKGRGRAAADNFAQVFNGAFDNSLPESLRLIEGSDIEIAGILFEIIPTDDAFDLYMPQANLIYTHMLGSDKHSIIESIGQAQVIIERLERYMSIGADVIISSHHQPEYSADIQDKLGYLKNLISIAGQASNAEDFQTRLRKAYPELTGDNYLEMTAAALFPASSKSD